MFIELACTLGGLTQRDVARRLGTMTEHGVGKERGLVRSALAGDTRLRAKFDTLRDRTPYHSSTPINLQDQIGRAHV